MIQNRSFYHATINNIQMAIIKSDIQTGKEYFELVQDKQIGERIFSQIHSEYERTRNALLKITQNNELLRHTPNIKESVHLRNPYIDPLNFLQIDLIKKLRDT